MASFTFTGSPPPEVSAYFSDKNLRPAFRWTEIWGQEHAHAFTVAKAVQLDVLATIQASLQKAIDEGTPYKQWAKALTPELQKAGWWGKVDMADPATGEVKPRQLGSPRRLQTIYDANLRTARAAGQWERAQRTKAVLPYFSYELGPSEHHREEHVAREGFIAPVDAGVWDAWYPPNGWGCKCWLRQITRGEAGRRGGPSPDDDDVGPLQIFTRKRDDGSTERVQVPRGIDPGWATNPGKSRSRTLMTSLNTKLEQAGPATARAAMKDFWAGDTPRAFATLSGHGVLAPVALLPAPVKSELGAIGSVVGVPASRLRRKLDKPRSRPVSANDLGRVQDVLDNGRLVERRGDSRAYLLQMDDGWWLAAIARDRAAQPYLASFYPITEAEAEDKLGKGAGGGS